MTLLARSALAQGLAVVDSFGKPVPSARVTLLAPAGDGGALDRLMPPLADERTDAQGRSGVRVPALAGVLLVVDHPQFVPHIARSPEQGLERVVLTPGHPWAGQIAGLEDEVEHGRVCATWKTDFDPAHARTWRRCADLDRAGAFTLVGVSARQRVRLEARVEGFLPGEIATRAGESFELRLQRGRMVRGRVIERTTKTPVAEAVVRSETGSLAHTNLDGHFELAVNHLPVRIDVGARGYRVSQLRVTENDLGQVTKVLLRPAPTITGRLLSEDGIPIRHAVLWLEQRDAATNSRRSRQRSVDLQDDGSFIVGLDRPGTYRLRMATRTGHRAKYAAPFFAQDGKNVDIGTHVLSTGAGVEGLVLAAHDAAPVAGVSIELLPVGPQLLRALGDRKHVHAVSDGEGKFVVTGLDTGRYELRIRHDDFATQVQALTLVRDQVTDLGTVWLDDGAKLRGRVVGQEGGRPGVQVVVLGPDPESMVPLVSVTTDPNGQFVGPALGIDRYRVQVLSGRPLLSTEFELREGGAGVELVVPPSALNGLVTDHGNPVDGGTVMVLPAFDPDALRGKMLLRMPGSEQPFGYGLQQRPQEASVGSDGTFSFTEVPGQPVRATYIADDGHRIVRYLGIPDHRNQPVNFEIGGAALRGRTTDRETGDEVQATVRLLDGLGVEVAHVETDGGFEIGRLAAGKYLARAFAEGYAPATMPLDITDRDVEIDLVLEPAAASTLVVHLERWDGSPVAGVPVTLLEPSGGVAASAPTDSSGQRVFSRLAAGEYSLVWSDSVAGTGAALVTLRAGESKTAEYKLPAGSRITLSCSTPTCGSAAIGLRLTTLDGFDLAPFLPGLDAVSAFAEDGRLALGALSPGEYRIQVALGNGDSAARAFTVGEGGTQVVSVF